MIGTIKPALYGSCVGVFYNQQVIDKYNMKLLLEEERQRNLKKFYEKTIK